MIEVRPCGKCFFCCADCADTCPHDPKGFVPPGNLEPDVGYLPTQDEAQLRKKLEVPK